MKRNSTSPVGALHPILFFAGVYFVALFFSIFICSSIFYSCNTTSRSAASGKLKATEIKETETAMVIVKK